MRRILPVFAAACCILFAKANPAEAELIILVGDTASSESMLGDFTAEMTYSFSSATAASLQINIKNTAADGFLTAFAYNNPSELITDVMLASAPSGFQLLGGPNFNDDAVNAAPFGLFDIGVSTGSNWEGGGPPSNGLGAGVMGAYTFDFAGDGLDGLTTLDFVKALSIPSDGHGATFFVARFRGFSPSGSDKVPAIATPEPPSWLIYVLVTTAMSGVFWWQRRRRSGPYPCHVIGG